MSFASGLYARKLDLDSNRNILFCLLKSRHTNQTTSQIVCVQLDQKRERYSSVVDTIRSPEAYPGERFTRIAWLSRVQCTLLAASDRGVLRFYDLESGSAESTLFQLAPPGNLPQSLLMDFQSSFLEYSRERNIIFAGGKDGRVGVWRLPDCWRAKEIDQLERDFEFSRKTMMRLKAASGKR